MNTWALAAELARVAVDKFDRSVSDRRWLERAERELERDFRRMLAAEQAPTKEAGVRA